MKNIENLNSQNRIKLLEDVRLRMDKEAVIDYAENHDEEVAEILNDFFPPKPKRYVVTAEQFEQIINYLLVK